MHRLFLDSTTLFPHPPSLLPPFPPYILPLFLNPSPLSLHLPSASPPPPPLPSPFPSPPLSLPFSPLSLPFSLSYFQALLYKKYTTSSDVWSYGMVLYEIWSVGYKPFQNLSNNDVVALVNTGHCQPPPPGCPRAIYSLMVECW